MHRPATHRGTEWTATDSSVTRAARMAAPLASSMVRRRPRVSKRAPVRMRPRPLHTASTPTRVVDRAALAPTERERSCKGDNGVAHGGQEDDAQEGTPEGEAAEHLAGGVVGGLKVLLYPVGGRLGRGAGTVPGAGRRIRRAAATSTIPMATPGRERPPASPRRDSG